MSPVDRIIAWMLLTCLGIRPHNVMLPRVHEYVSFIEDQDSAVLSLRSNPLGANSSHLRWELRRQLYS
jgi:hypothetical protein